MIRRVADIDFRGAEHVPLEGLTDDAVLAIAAASGRVLVSHDDQHHARSFPRIYSQPHQSWRYGGSAISGIGKASECILLLCEACDPQDLENRVCLLPSF